MEVQNGNINPHKHTSEASTYEIGFSEKYKLNVKKRKVIYETKVVTKVMMMMENIDIENLSHSRKELGRSVRNVFEWPQPQRHLHCRLHTKGRPKADTRKNRHSFKTIHILFVPRHRHQSRQYKKSPKRKMQLSTTCSVLSTLLST